MDEALRFHLDEHIHPAIAEALGRRNINVSTTQDADFLRLHRSGEPHAGVVYCRLQRLSIGDITRGLILLRERLSADEMVNRVEFL